MARYQPRDADFVLVGDDSWDEELPAPRELDPLWMRYGGRPAAYLLAACVVTGCVVRVAASDESPAPAAAPASPVSVRRNDLAGQGYVVQAPVAPRDGGGLISDDLSGDCPAAQSCLTSTAVPAALLAALRAAFPHATDVTVRTVSLPDSAGAGRILGRIVHADAGLTSVTVQVLPGRRPPDAGVTGTGNGAIAYVQRPVGTMTVRATVAGTGVSDRPDAPPARLAADPRMLAVG